MAALADEDIAVLKELSRFIASLPRPVATLIIFAKNVSAILLSFVLSPILCFVPVLTLVLNGLLLAIVSVSVAQEESLGFILAGLLPHGIFEIPALILGQAAALSFGTTLMLALFSQGKRSQLVPRLKRDVRYLLIAFGLLVPAAIIEVYITPLFLK